MDCFCSPRAPKARQQAARRERSGAKVRGPFSPVAPAAPAPQGAEKTAAADRPSGPGPEEQTLGRLAG